MSSSRSDLEVELVDDEFLRSLEKMELEAIQEIASRTASQQISMTQEDDYSGLHVCGDVVHAVTSDTFLHSYISSCSFFILTLRMLHSKWTVKMGQPGNNSNLL